MGRPRRFTKRHTKARLLFKERIMAELRRYGAVSLFPSEQGRMFLLTPLGKLDITVHDSWIHTCFEDNVRGYAFTDRVCPGNVSNQFTGKWNFHYTDEPLTLEDPNAGKRFFSYIKQLMDCYRRLG